MEQSSYKAMSAARSFRSLSAAPGVVWNGLWLVPVLLWLPLTAARSCWQKCAVDLELAFLSLATCPQDGQGTRRNGLAWGAAATPGIRAVSPLSLVLRISSKQPMAREQTVSPLTSVAPTLDLNTASSPGLDSAGAGALPRCEKRGCVLPSCLFSAFPAAPKRNICPVYLLPLLQPGFTAHIGLL